MKIPSVEIIRHDSNSSNRMEGLRIMNPQIKLRADVRPVVRGKSIFAGGKKIFVRGVTYGTFRPDADGRQFPARETVERDFARMAASGVNSVRTYTVPPRWLLDAAQKHGLFVMVGLPWEQHISFLS